MTNYGTVTIDGKTYTLTGEADYTSRLLPSGYVNYHEANEGDAYDFEMSAPAADDEGTKYLIYWLFEGIKGDNDPELDTYDFTTADRVVEA